jgi:hypothetical protein
MLFGSCFYGVEAYFKSTSFRRADLTLFRELIGKILIKGGIVYVSNYEENVPDLFCMHDIV